MAEDILFYYFGDDEAYFRTLQGEFRKHTSINAKFTRFFESSESKIQSFFLKIYQDRPAVIFIDFSKQTQDYLHLARLVSRTSMEHKMLTVGLVDYLSPPEVISESIATGVNLTHIKSAESFDVVFDVGRLISPPQMVEHGFATAALKEEYEAGVPAKVGYIHKDGLHFETDHKLTKGDRIRLNHAWTASKIVPSKEVFVRDVSESNLFYQFKYGCDVDFLFIDEFLPPEGMEQERVDERRKEREELIVHQRKQLKRWIDDNMSRSQEKKAKVLVVDRQFHFYQSQQRTDKHAYIVRCVPFFRDVGEELGRLRPRVIAYSMEKDDEAGAVNTNEELVKLSQVIKAKFPDLNPFIVIFNCPASSQDMQQGLNYSQVMATASELSVDVLVRMADIFEKKMEGQLVSPPDSKEKVFLKKTNTDSICEILIQIKVVKLSETDMVFQSDVPLPIGTNLHLTKPVEMYINVQPLKAAGKTPEYHGLIHCLGEDQKKELRKYVNSVFFREHDGKKQEELDKFKQLNEAKLNARVEADKAAQAAKEKEAEAQAAEDAEAQAPAEGKNDETAS